MKKNTNNNVIHINWENNRQQDASIQKDLLGIKQNLVKETPAPAPVLFIEPLTEPKPDSLGRVDIQIDEFSALAA